MPSVLSAAFVVGLVAGGIIGYIVARAEMAWFAGRTAARRSWRRKR